MFQNKRFLTRGVQAEIPIELQLFLWHCIDNLPEERDYFQVFKLDVANGKQHIHHFPNSRSTVKTIDPKHKALPKKIGRATFILRRKNK